MCPSADLPLRNQPASPDRAPTAGRSQLQRNIIALNAEGQAAVVLNPIHTFDVPVDLLLRVQVVKPLQDLLEHGGNLRLVKRTCPQLRVYTHTHTHNDTDIKHCYGGVSR